MRDIDFNNQLYQYSLSFLRNYISMFCLRLCDIFQDSSNRGRPTDQSPPVPSNLSRRLPAVNSVSSASVGCHNSSIRPNGGTGVGVFRWGHRRTLVPSTDHCSSRNSRRCDSDTSLRRQSSTRLDWPVLISFDRRYIHDTWLCRPQSAYIERHRWTCSRRALKNRCMWRAHCLLSVAPVYTVFLKQLLILYFESECKTYMNEFPFTESFPFLSRKSMNIISIMLTNEWK